MENAPTPEVIRRESVWLSVVIPLRNEAQNVESLIREIDRALAESGAYEVVCIDDGSSDATPDLLARLADEFPRLRPLRHATSAGQSTAVSSGVLAARGGWIATLDGDGQNDPADLLPMLAVARAERERGGGPILVAGRRRRRRDSWAKRMASQVANAIRSRILGDATADTGCGLKVFERDAFLGVPHFDHMHRFLPALFLRQGGRVISVDVNHRERRGGRSNYGVFDRLWVGIVDLLGVWWLKRRACRATAVPLESSTNSRLPLASSPSAATR